jgi:hypothetical protein
MKALLVMEWEKPQMPRSQGSNHGWGTVAFVKTVSRIAREKEKIPFNVMEQ